MDELLKPELDAVRTLIFDIGGTVFNWLSAITAALDDVPAEHLPPGFAPVEFAVAIRSGFFDLYGQVYRDERGWLTADAIYAAVVADLVARHGLQNLSAVNRVRLDQAWRAMPAWPDAPGVAEIIKVAAHPSDLRPAAASGFRTAYVRPRLADPGEDYRDTGFAGEFDIVAEDFDDLARQPLD